MPFPKSGPPPLGSPHAPEVTARCAKPSTYCFQLEPPVLNPEYAGIIRVDGRTMRALIFALAAAFVILVLWVA